LKPAVAGVAAGAAVVSHATVQQQEEDSPRVQQEKVQRAKHHDRKPDGNNLVIEIEIMMIGRNVVMKSGKTARNTVKMHAKIVRTSLMMKGMITMITIIIMAV
jgi:sRNA-binding protein